MSRTLSAPAGARCAALGMLALAILALGACNTATGGIPPAPSGVEGMVTTPVFREDGSLLHPRSDDDGDGIPNQDEVDGYTITVDVNGFAVVGGDEMLEVREVTSDPRYYDTDGDGLSDGRERMVTSDPRRVDSDGDTLPDSAEVERFGTSPVSIDTDGDARGGDPENPRPPQFALFDAAELRLAVDPSHPEGPRVPSRGATNPADADTDGDGVNDYDELHSGLRRATLAEVPNAILRLTPASDITLGLNVVTTSGTDLSASFTDTRSTSNAVDTSFTALSETTLSFDTAVGVFSRGEATVGCCGDWGSVREEVGVRVEQETRFEQTLSMDATAEYAHTLSEISESARALETTETIEVNGGVIRFSVDVLNSSLVPFRISDVTFGVFLSGRGREAAVPITEITAPEEMVLAPGASRTVQLARNDIETETMYALLANPQRLNVRIERFNLAGADGLDLAFRLEDVRGRTAHVVVDFGDGRLIERDVATPGLEAGKLATVARLLEEIGLDFEGRLVTDREEPYYAIRIEDLETELFETLAPTLSDALPYSERSFGGPGPRAVRRGWVAVIDRRERPASPPAGFANLLEGDVHPGDIVTLHFTEDLDRDGVPASVERIFGSSDETPHSDRDGLSDYWEIYERWTVQVVGVPDYLANPSPAQEDGDGDGLSDLAEAQLGTDPRMTDTDLDTLTDLQEQDEAYSLDARSDRDMPELPTVSCEADMVVPTRAESCWVSAMGASGAGRRLFPCRLLGDPRGDCSVGTPSGVRDGSICRVYEDVAVPQELWEATMPSGPSLTLCDRRDGDTYPCNVRSPLGGSPSCVVAVGLSGAVPGATANRVIPDWTILPCSAFFDSDFDGSCDSARDTETGPPAGDPAARAMALEEVTRELNGDRGLPFSCAAIQTHLDPVMVLDITATDPQDDLVEVSYATVPFGRMQYSLAPTGSFTLDDVALPHTCAARPEEITVVATDRYGFRAEVECAWRGGVSCVQ